MAKMKLKTHSGAKKRFKLTKNGKIKRGQPRLPQPYPDQEDHQAHPRLPSALLCGQHQRRYPEADAALRLSPRRTKRLTRLLR